MNRSQCRVLYGLYLLVIIATNSVEEGGRIGMRTHPIMGIEENKEVGYPPS